MATGGTGKDPVPGRVIRVVAPTPMRFVLYEPDEGPGA
jgi:hypothetical protein